MKLFKSQIFGNYDCITVLETFVDTLECYIQEWAKRKNELNEPTIKCLIFSILNDIPNGVRSEFRFKNGRNSFYADIAYCNEDIALIIELKRSDKTIDLYKEVLQAQAYLSKCDPRNIMCYLVMNLHYENGENASMYSVRHYSVQPYGKCDTKMVLMHSIHLNTFSVYFTMPDCYEKSLNLVVTESKQLIKQNKIKTIKNEVKSVERT